MSNSVISHLSEYIYGSLIKTERLFLDFQFYIYFSIIVVLHLYLVEVILGLTYSFS